MQGRLVELLREGAHRHPGSQSPSGLAEQAAVGAAMSIVASSLAAGELDTLAEHRPTWSRSPSRPTWAAKRRGALAT